MSDTAPSACPCGSGLAYDACCGPLLAGERAAPTAEALMRSRYCAFAQNELDYIVATMGSRQRKAFDASKVVRLNRETRWTGLDIHETVQGGPEDDTGEVFFTAHFEHGGKSGELQEHSLFTRKDGRWFYTGKRGLRRDAAGATTTTAATSQKVGRNEPCPCGSGKKYKKCCAGQ